MPDDAPAPTIEARARWIERVLGYRITLDAPTQAASVQTLMADYQRLGAAQRNLLGEIAANPDMEHLGAEAAPRADELAAIASALAAPSLDAEAVGDLQRRLREVEAWQQTAARALGVAVQRPTLREELAALQNSIATTAAQQDDATKRRLDDLADQLTRAVTKNIEHGDVDSASARIEGFRQRLADEQARLQRRADDAKNALENADQRIAAMAPFAPDEPGETIRGQHKTAMTALAGGRLPEAEAASTELTRQLNELEKARAVTQAKQAEAARRAELRKQLEALQKNIALTAAPHEGRERRWFENLSDELATAVTGNIERGNMDSAGARMVAFAERLEAQKVELAKRFDTAETGLSSLRERLAALIPLAPYEGDAGGVQKAILDASDTLGRTRLAAAEAKIAALKGDLDSIEHDRAESGAVQQRYKALKGVLDKVMGFSPDDLSNDDSAAKLEKIQKRIAGVADDFDSNLEQGGWSAMASEVETLEGLLKLADNELADDEKAKEAIEAAKIAAAAKLLSDQKAQAAAKQAALEAFQETLAAALAAGDNKFGAPDLVKKVWNKTRSVAPNGGNEGIGGTYSYDDIMAAIAIWNGVELSDGFVACHVPGYGSIQDKRPKGRNEVQANFISDYGNGGRVNMHVNLRESEWAKIA